MLPRRSGFFERVRPRLELTFARSAKRAKLQIVAGDPLRKHPWAKRLTGQPGYRVRQRDWRAVYRLDHEADEMTVEIIAKRDEIYR